jgi:hypothetical protein
MEKFGRPSKSTDDNIIWSMRFACWITKTRDTHWEYVILIAFHVNNCYVKASQCYVIFPVSLTLALGGVDWWASRPGCFALGEAACSRVQLKCDGTRRTVGEVKRKLANGVGSQYSSHYLGTWCIQQYYRWCTHLGCQQSTELTPPPI